MHASHGGACASCACVNWDYEKHDKAKAVKSRCFDLLVGLRTKSVQPIAAVDTRPIHAAMFKGLTHPDCPYFAGHYRGSRDCLVNYEVHVGGASTAPSTNVQAQMSALAAEIQADLAAVQQPSNLPPAEALVSRLDVVLDRMVEFLAIHPYANGNGHMQRFIVWCYLAAMNLWPKRWPMDERPPRPYDEFIHLYRKGVKDPLRAYVLGLLKR